jgi:hypothetical protein
VTGAFAPLREAPVEPHTAAVSNPLVPLLLTAPWVVAIAWITRRAGRRVLLGDREAFPSQADELRAFGAR